MLFHFLVNTVTLSCLVYILNSKKLLTLSITLFCHRNYIINYEINCINIQHVSEVKLMQ